MDLSNFGLKNTKTRNDILDILKASTLPLTAEDVFKKLMDKGINLSTVYRTLQSFYERAIISKEISKDGKALYFINKKEHKHVLVCIKCNAKLYLDSCPYEEVNEQIFQKTGYKIDNHSIELYGLCPNCQIKK